MRGGRVEIITEHGQDVQMFINDQHRQIIGLGQVARPGGLGTARSHHAR